MLDSEKLAIAAHLHVLLRRKAGRVTDTEWLATNTAYATEIIRFTRQKAAEDGHTDLAEWADKLEKVFTTSPAVRPALVQARPAMSSSDHLRVVASAPPLAAVVSTDDASSPVAGAVQIERYVGRLR